MHSSLNRAAMFPSLSVTCTIIVTRVLTKNGKQIITMHILPNQYIYCPISYKVNRINDILSNKKI